jgi:hypothetical protein
MPDSGQADATASFPGIYMKFSRYNLYIEYSILPTSIMMFCHAVAIKRLFRLLWPPILCPPALPPPPLTTHIDTRQNKSTHIQHSGKVSNSSVVDPEILDGTTIIDPRILNYFFVPDPGDRGNFLLLNTAKTFYRSKCIKACSLKPVTTVHAIIY